MFASLLVQDDGSLHVDRERIWIDLNRDSKWDAFNEQFPFRPMLVLGDERWAVRAARMG